MSGSDASSSEMPKVPLPGLAGRDQDELLLDRILDRRPLPPNAPPGMLALAEKLAGLAARPGAGELPGEAAALAAFLRSSSPASTLVLAGEPPGRRRGHRLRAGRARLSAAAAVLVVGLSGTAAAYAGVLPASVQNFAHRMIDAPAARHAADHGHGAPGQRGGHPGVMRSSPSVTGPAHPAKPGKEKAAHKPRHHGRHHGKPAKKPKPTRPAHTAGPTSTPSPGHLVAKPHPSPSPGLRSR